MLLLVVPNAFAAFAAIVAYQQHPEDALSIGTFVGVFAVAYGALAAPWITGYLDDKRKHSEVLQRLFFGKYTELTLGNAGVSPGLAIRYGADEYLWHLPISIDGRYSGTIAGRKEQMSSPLALDPVFGPASSHMRRYPMMWAAWCDAVRYEKKYNERRPAVLKTISEVVSREMGKLDSSLLRRDSSWSPVPGAPYYDSQAVLAMAYLRVPIPSGRTPFWNFVIEESVIEDRKVVGIAGRTWAVFGTRDRAPSASAFDATVLAISRDPAVAQGVGELRNLEGLAWAAVNQLFDQFRRVSALIELGHRIKGTCDELGY